MKRYILPFMLILLLMAAACSQASDQYKITVTSGGRWPAKGSGESDKDITGKGGLPKESPKAAEETEATTAQTKNPSSATTAKKKKSTSATTAVAPFDHDIEAYYEDNKDIYDSYDDAWDGFEDDEDAWDDY